VLADINLSLEWKWQLPCLLKHLGWLGWFFGLGLFLFSIFRQSRIPESIKSGEVHVLISPYDTQLDTILK
jgi:hypothetical protein